MPAELKRVAVFCGAQRGGDPIYAQAAQSLAEALYRAQLSLVYGGATVGLMGILADACLKLGSQVIGVIPESIANIEKAHQQLTQLHIVSSMHERKAMMEALSDAFILMPGGFGSLDEFFEIVTWMQLGYHAKPVAIYNMNGYFDHLINFIDHSVASGFVKPAHKDVIVMANSAEAVVAGLFNS